VAERDRFSLFCETDDDSVLSGSICYSAELGEDNEVLSEVGSEVGLEASLLLNTMEDVHPYLFETERSSSEPDVAIPEVRKFCIKFSP